MKPYAPEIIPIARPLAASRRQLRVLSSLSGLFAVFWTALLALLGLGIADYLLHLAGQVRLGAMFLLAGYVLYGLVAWVLRPLIVKVPLDVIAARVEQQNPWLQDRLRSALDFASEEVPGSREMQQLVVNEMLASVGKIDASAITDTRPLKRALLMSVVPLLVLAGFGWAAPAHLQIGIDRLFAPLGESRWPKSVQIELVDELPQSVPLGQRLELSARLKRGDRPNRQVIVSWQIGAQPVQRQLMQRNEQGAYDVAIDVRTPSGVDATGMQLWIEAGDDLLGPIAVGLVPRLQVSSVIAAVKAPPYTGTGEISANLRTQAATIPAGSDVVLTVDFSRPVTKVEFQPVGASESLPLPAITFARRDARSFTASWRADESLRFRVLAKDENGYGNPAAEEFEIIARPDQQPTVQLESPRKSEERTAEATVPLVAIAEDDYGISAMALEARLLPVDPNAAPASSAPVALPLVEEGSSLAEGVQFGPADSESRRARSRLGYEWKLISFPSALLRPGDVIEFHVSALDAYDLDGQRHPAARTPALRITIVSQDQLLQRVYDDLRQIATQLSEVQTRQERLRGDTAQLAEDIAAKGSPDAADQQVASRIADQQSRAASQSREASARLSEIAKRLQENASPNKQLQETAASAGKTLEQAAENSMRPAAADVKQGADPAQDKQQREAAMEKAQREQQDASEKLTQVLDALGDVGGVGRAIDMVQELLTGQRQATDSASEFARDHAGRRPEDLSPEDRKKLEDLAREQGELASRTETTLEQLRNMAQRQGEQDQAAAEALRQAAQTGQEQSVSQHQQRASQAVGQNQSSQASSSQRSAEQGLQQMLDSLKDAQRRKLEELARQLADMQQQMRNLVRRQASHNLDNLVVRAAIGGEFAETARALANKAGRQEIAEDGANAEQLTASQQQTHVNAADLLEQIDKIRGAAEVAGHLGRATGRMERAVALLRQQKLSDAYAPPQTDALAELELALKAISDLKEEAEQQGQDDQKEKLRKAYEDVRDQQVQIRDATKLLDQSLSGERKRRADLIRLAQVSTDQQKLAEILRPLTTQLEELGSAIFVRTSEAIGRDMTAVSAAMAEQKTGRATQLSQTQIVARLDAIIRALTEAKNEDESKYATRSSQGEGGGGGGGSRRLPPAAELMLIRDLQELVNNTTKELTGDDGEVMPLVAGEQGGIRESFDALIRSVSPEAKLPDEKASRELVPEETDPAPDADLDALDQELLTDAPAGEEEDVDLQLIGRRMTRSQVRLGEQKDPGRVTQLVQERILKQLDKIIDEARQQQQQQQQQQASGQQQAKPDPNAQPNQDSSAKANQQSSNPAQRSEVTPGRPVGEPSGDIRETAKEWGGLSERERQAIIESAGEDVVEKYREMTEDYYRALSIKATENK